MQFSRKGISIFEWAGYLLILLGILISIWGFSRFDSAASPEQMGQFGEFTGGIVGSLWALAGVFLFFATLTYQKREFELQRIELNKTQKIFQQQNFSTLFTSFFSQHNQIINELSAHDIANSEWHGNEFFVLFKEKVLSSYVAKVRSLSGENRTPEILHNILKDYFIYHFSFYRSTLNPYLRSLTVLLSMINRYRSETGDSGEYYSFILKTNMMPAELFLLYHLAFYNLLPGFRELSTEFAIDALSPPADKAEALVQHELKQYRNPWL